MTAPPPSLEDAEGTDAADGDQKPVSLASLLGDTAVYGLADISNKAIGFLLLPVTTSLLSTSDFGIGSLFGATAQMLLLFASMGVPISFFRFYTERRSADERRDVLATAVWIAAGYAAAWLTPVVVFRQRIGEEIFGVSTGAFSIALAAMTVLVLCNNLGNCRLQADGRRIAFLTTNLSATIVSRTVMVILLVRGWGAWGWILADILGECVTASVLLGLVYRDLRPRFDRKIAVELIPYGATLVPVALSHWIMTGCDKYMINGLLPDPLPRIGIYSLGERIGSIMQLVNLAFLYGWRRFAFRNMHLADGVPLLSRGMTLYAVAAGYVALGIILLGDDLLFWFVREEFAGAAEVVPALTLAALLWGLGEVASTGLHKARRTVHFVWLNFGAAAANIALNLYTIPSFGIWGAALSTLVCQAAKTVLLHQLAQRAFPIAIEWGRLAAAAGMLLGGYAIGRSLAFVGQPSETLFQAATMVGVTLLLTTLLHPSERRRLKQLVLRATRGSGTID